MRLTAKVHREDGSLWAEVVELPGCFASGDTLDELVANLDEAIGLYREGSPAEGSAVEVAELVMESGAVSAAAP